MRVAVYGTLKKGEANYLRWLAGAEPVFRGFVDIRYRMYENGEYPMLVPASESHPILVEVFDLSEEKLREIDRLEEPFQYWRETIVIDGLGEVGIYVHHAPPPPGFTIVESGEWRS